MKRNEQAFGGFAVPYSPEYLKFRSDPILLKQIAERTGGSSFVLDDHGCAEPLLQAIQERIERGGRQELRGAEIGVHRPLAVGRDEDQALRGWRLGRARRGRKGDIEGADIVRENPAKLVIRDLPYESAAGTKRREAGQQDEPRHPGFLRSRWGIVYALSLAVHCTSPGTETAV